VKPEAPLELMDRESIEITAGAVAAILFCLSELLGLSQRSDCNSVAQLLANAARCIRPAADEPPLEGDVEQP